VFINNNSKIKKQIRENHDCQVHSFTICFSSAANPSKITLALVFTQAQDNTPYSSKRKIFLLVLSQKIGSRNLIFNLELSSRLKALIVPYLHLNALNFKEGGGGGGG